MNLPYFITLPTSLVLDDRISCEAKITFGLICTLSDKWGEFYLSDKEISELLKDINYTEDAVSRHITELINNAYLLKHDEYESDLYTKHSRILSLLSI